MNAKIQKELEERDLRYKESDFWHNPIIGKEIVRFRWGNPKYRDHYRKVVGIRYFDEFIMEELKRIAEENSGGFKP